MGDSKNKFDICVITTIHKPLDARIYERGVRCYVEAGYSVCLICPWKRPDDGDLKHAWRAILPLPKKRIRRIRHGFRIFREALKTRARIYHFHDIDFILWAVFLRYLKQTPVIYDCHENYPEEVRFGKLWMPYVARVLVSPVLRLYENWCARRLSFCIVPVPNLLKRFSQLGVKTVLIRNFTSFKPRPKFIESQFLLKDGLICTGHLNESYGVYVLLSIAQKLKCNQINLPLIIFDRFRNNTIKNEFLRTIINNRLDIIIHPLVPSHKVANLLKNAFIGLSVEQKTPHKLFAYPSKLFEYMAFGLPIVASDLPLTREIISTAQCGILVPPSEAKAYVKAVKTLIDDPEKYKQMSDNGIKAVRGVYSWKGEKKKLLEFVKSIQRNISHER